MTHERDPLKQQIDSLATRASKLANDFGAITLLMPDASLRSMQRGLLEKRFHLKPEAIPEAAGGVAYPITNPDLAGVLHKEFVAMRLREANMPGSEHLILQDNSDKGKGETGKRRFVIHAPESLNELPSLSIGVTIETNTFGDEQVTQLEYIPQ